MEPIETKTINPAANKNNIELIFEEIEKLKKQNQELLRRIKVLEDHDPVKIIQY